MAKHSFLFFMLTNKSWEMEWAGRKLIIETGKLARQANSALTVRYGDTMVLATVVKGKKPREGVDYFPLLVDYEEKFYAAGKIKSSRFLKREGRPTDEAVTTARLIDRAIRPLFNEADRLDVQVILTVFSIDDDNDPDVPALIAASAALSLCNLGWAGPLGAIRIGRVNNEWVLNSTYQAREKSELDLVVAGAREKIVMIEAGASEVSEEVIMEAIRFSKKHLNKVVDFLAKIKQEMLSEIETKSNLILAADSEPASKSSTDNQTEAPITETEVLKLTQDFLDANIYEHLFNLPKAAKQERLDALKELEKKLDIYLAEKEAPRELRAKALKLVKSQSEQSVTKAILQENKRVDGRALTDIRDLNMEVALLPRTHGSSLFNRGETQVLSTVTLGSPGDVQILDSMELEGKKRYIHHYNFPPYCVGECFPLRGPSRREIGHGSLSERALDPMMPKKEDFPYTIRVVSEVLSSNGSSSMASVCSSSLALLDAGVKIKNPVAGIAMGLASDDQGGWKVITDLQDLEDGQGGMDFKIAGSKDGITAIQMDTKTLGLSDEIIEATLKQAKEARFKILAEMTKVIAAPRADLSPLAPRIFTLKIDREKIGLIIGPQGKTINAITEETGVDIDIEDDGLVMVTADSKDAADKAIEKIKALTRDLELGGVYEGKVTKIFEFGAMVEILPKTEGLVHISNLSDQHINRVEDVVSPGDILKVKVVEIDHMGRPNLCVEGVKNCARPSSRSPRRDNNFDSRQRPAFNSFRRPTYGGGRGQFRNNRQGDY